MKEWQLLNAFKNPDEFKRLVKLNHELLETAKLFPQHAETLINIVLNNPDEFKRLVRHNNELRETAKLFPQHADIFGKSTVNEAADAALAALSKKSCAEIRKNARIIAQSLRTRSGRFFFKGLPYELLLKIITLTGNHAVHDEKNKPEDIVSQNFCRPN